MSQETQPLTEDFCIQKYLRRLPHSVDAEFAILGALVVGNRDIYKRLSFLRPEYFVLENHAEIYRQICAVYVEHDRCDPVLLSNWFRTLDDAVSIFGEPKYLVELADCAATPLNAEQYALHLVDLHQRRRAISIAETMSNRAYKSDADDPAETVLRDAVSEIEELQEATPAEVCFRDVGDILTDVFGRASERIDKRLRGEPSGGILSGIFSLDSLLGGFEPGTVTLIAGRPSMGKSTVAANIAFNVAMAGTPVAFFTMEVRDDSLVRQNIQARVTKVSGHALRVGEKLSHYDVDRARQAVTASGIDKMPLRISHVPALTTDTMRQMLLHEAKRTEIGLVIVDYLQIMRASDKKTYSRNDEVSQLSRDIKAIAVEMDIPILLLSQLSRALEARDDKRPQLSDLRDSGSLEQDADNVIFVYREHYYRSRKNGSEVYGGADEYANIANDIELIVGKQRSGPIGTAKAWFSGALSYVGDEPLIR